MSSRWLIAGVLLAALLGFGFAAAATYDFAAHLDRQVHALHCSFIPGMSGDSREGSEGCQLTLMSPYSSVLRTRLWGGVPISLLAMGVFCVIAAQAALILRLRAEHDSMALISLLLLTSLPVGASLVMGAIAAFKLHAVCKQCIGIYSASTLIGVCALLAYRKLSQLLRGQVLLVASPWLCFVPLTALTVAVLTGSYVLAMPSYRAYAAGCGMLQHEEDRHNVLVHLPAPHTGAPHALEVFDPLCPACKAFEERLVAAQLDEQFTRDLLLFPLDDSCNWMVENAMHPGSCEVSLAVLCAGERASEVIAWAFEEQRTIKQQAARGRRAAERVVAERFPELVECIKAPTSKARLSQSLRWAVRNQIPVLTPQFYVRGKRICDEDTDLGLEYTLTRMLHEDGS